MKVIGKMLMVLPIQLFASHFAIHNGFEFGGIWWRSFIIIIGFMFLVGFRLATEK